MVGGEEKAKEDAKLGYESGKLGSEVAGMAVKLHGSEKLDEEVAGMLETIELVLKGRNKGYGIVKTEKNEVGL